MQISGVSSLGQKISVQHLSLQSVAAMKENPNSSSNGFVFCQAFCLQFQLMALYQLEYTVNLPQQNGVLTEETKKYQLPFPLFKNLFIVSISAHKPTAKSDDHDYSRKKGWWTLPQLRFLKKEWRMCLNWIRQRIYSARNICICCMHLNNAPRLQKI